MDDRQREKWQGDHKPFKPAGDCLCWDLLLLFKVDLSLSLLMHTSIAVHVCIQVDKRCRWTSGLVCKFCHLHIEAVFFVFYLCCPVMAGDVFHLFDFIRDLSKCPEADVDRHREGQADRCSDRSVSDWIRPEVSPISAWLYCLIEHWGSTVYIRLCRSNHRDKTKSWRTWLIFASNISSVDGCDWITAVWDVFAMFTFAVPLCCNYWRPCRNIGLASFVTTCAIWQVQNSIELISSLI